MRGCAGERARGVAGGSGRFSYRTLAGSTISVFSMESKLVRAGLPQNNIFAKKTAPAEVGGLQLRVTCGGREIMHVVLDNAIFVEDFRYLEDPGGGGPVGGVARKVSDRSTGE